MAEDDKVAEEVRAEGVDEHEFDIQRDESFVRIAADNVIVIDRGNDVELSLIVQGPDPVVQVATVLKNGERVQRSAVQMAVSYTEVARIRLVPPVAVTMAMQTIEAMLDSKMLKLPVFKAAVLDLLSRYEEKFDEGKSEIAPK